MTRNQILATVLGFYTVTHSATAFLLGTNTLLIRLLAVVVLVGCVFKGVKHSLNVLAAICGLFAVSGVTLLLRLESDWPIYTAVAGYSAISALFVWVLLRSPGPTEAAAPPVSSQ